MFCKPNLTAVMTRKEEYVDTPEYDMDAVWKDIEVKCEHEHPSCDCANSPMACLKS